ncbi:MAG: CinA family protein [Bacteroidota bacterium]
MGMHTQVNSFVKKLQKKSLTLALAESITCGMATHKLATCKGTADVLAGSVICYTPEVKNKLLGISKKIIKKHTCESMEVTDALATNLSHLITADIYAALTGLASKGGSETKNKPVGTVFFCVNYKNELYKQRKLFKGSPSEIREKSCLELYKFILSVV